MEIMTKNRTINAVISAALTLINPGLGQLRNGQILKAVLFYLLWYFQLFLLLWSAYYRTFPGLILFIIPYLILYTYFITDAYYVAFKTAQGVLKPYNRWFIYIIVIGLNLIVAKNIKDYINLNWFTAHRVPTKSMEPTLQAGDYFIGDYKYYKPTPSYPAKVSF